MRRVLFISTKPDAPWIGSCHRVRHMLDSLRELGYAVDLLCTPSPTPLDHPGMQIYKAPSIPFCRLLPEGPCFRRFLFDTAMLCKALTLAAQGNYDLLHGVDDGGILAYFVSRVYKIPYVIDRQSDFDGSRKVSSRFWVWLHRTIERHALKHAEAVSGNSASVIPLLSSLGRRSRACVIPDIPALPLEVPPAALQLAESRYRTAKGVPVITCVGSFGKFKGLDLFFNAMPHVLADFPLAQFVAVGGTKPEIMRTMHALKKAGILAAASFPGRLSPLELAALLKISDVLVSPRREGTTAPIKVLDYLAAGRPIVAADTPANRAILSSDNALITPSTPEGLAEGILRLCHFPGLGASLARRGTLTLQRENHTQKALCLALRHCYDYVITQWRREHETSRTTT